jgi:hypothetical protein
VGEGAPGRSIRIAAGPLKVFGQLVGASGRPLNENHVEDHPYLSSEQRLTAVVGGAVWVWDQGRAAGDVFGDRNFGGIDGSFGFAIAELHYWRDGGVPATLRGVGGRRFALPSFQLAGKGLAAPYVEGGVSLRTKPSKLVSDINGVANGNVSPLGVTFGAGIEIKALLVRISPEFRYTRWGRGALATSGGYVDEQNQAAVLVGISF